MRTSFVSSLNEYANDRKRAMRHVAVDEASNSLFSNKRIELIKNLLVVTIPLLVIKYLSALSHS